MSILETYIMVKDRARDHIFVYKKIKDIKDSGKMILKMEKVYKNLYRFNNI